MRNLLKTGFGLFALLFVIGVAISPANAVVLIMEDDMGDDLSTPGDYGDRVEAEVQDGFAYDLASGPTPHIVAEWGEEIEGHGTQYGDLVNIFYLEDNVEGLVFELTLRADPGYKVVLHSFDMGGWRETDYTIDAVEVRDGDGAILYREQDVHIEGDAGHTDFDFETPLAAPVIVIRFDPRNLFEDGDADNIGIDNIRFSEMEMDAEAPALPAAGDWALMGLAVLLAGLSAWWLLRSAIHTR